MAPSWLSLAGAVTAFYILWAFSWGAYTLEAVTTANVGIRRSLTSLLGSFGLLFLMFYFLKVGPDFSRAMSVMSLGFATALLITVRKLVSVWINRTYGQNLVKRIFISEGDMPVDVATLPTDQWVVASCPRPAEVEPRMRLAQIIKGADRVIVSCSRETASSWAQVLRWSGVQGEILLPDYQEILPIGVASFNKHPTLIISTGPLDAYQRFTKRTLDLLLGTVLLVLFAPLMVFVAILIKLASPGPVFFRQARIGERNTLFQIYKFRTMRNETADTRGEVSASRDDERVTRFGRLLRRTSIDEIPQLFNVLIGNMSIVGPRPHALGSKAEGQLFWEVDESYWHRHALKPGITGLAQIRGFRGATHTKAHLIDRVRADLEYIEGWSISRDIAIIARTLLVLIHRNAY
jgi:exopolysaccharide biosynthesis polyprenyl glycosylphosphotransferase